jgi:integrase
MHGNENFRKAYSGPLACMISEYIELKRALGYTYIAEAKAFRRFDEFTKGFDIPNGTLPKNVVLEWTQKRSREKPLTQKKRVNAVRCFSKFMQGRGYKAYVPPSPPKQSADPYIPYIFSEKEIMLLLALADEYRPTLLSPNLDKTVPIAFRILYGCGLRCSELVNLRIRDIDTERCLLTIREGKFRKDRLVPMAPSLANQCAEYIVSVNAGCGGDDFFLRSPYGRQYSVQAPYYWFRELLYHAGIPHGGKGKGPRLHDLRHTFAVHCLKRWNLQGKNVYALLPALSAYMGHCDLRGTQIYLRLTPDLFPHIAKAMDNFFNDAEVCDESN